MSLYANGHVFVFALPVPFDVDVDALVRELNLESDLCDFGLQSLPSASSCSPSPASLTDETTSLPALGREDSCEMFASLPVSNRFFPSSDSVASGGFSPVLPASPLSPCSSSCSSGKQPARGTSVLGRFDHVLCAPFLMKVHIISAMSRPRIPRWSD